MNIFAILTLTALLLFLILFVVYPLCKGEKDSDTSFVSQVDVETWVRDTENDVWRLWQVEPFDVWLQTTGRSLSEYDVDQIANMKRYLSASWIYWKDTGKLPLPAELQDKEWLAKMDEDDLLGPYGYKLLDDKVVR